MPLLIDVKVGESVSIDEGRVMVKVLDKSGQRARLEFDADKSIKITHIKQAQSSSIAAQGIKKPAFAGS
jgi:sRNA-binding carbon storage regulator CsrA